MKDQVTKQHEARAKSILARRGDPSYKEPKLELRGAADPTKQAEAMAEKVVAKQMRMSEAQSQHETKGEAPEVNADFEGESPKGATPYEDMTKKQLKAECDAFGIAYPKKATNEALIKLIKGRTDG